MSTDPKLDHLAEVPLDLARSIEHTVALCRSVRTHLEHGPFRRTRRRLRKQLDHLADVLDRAQLAALAPPLPKGLEQQLHETLPELEPRLEHVLYHELGKPELKALRKLAKHARTSLAAHVALPSTAAA